MVEETARVCIMLDLVYFCFVVVKEKGEGGLEEESEGRWGRLYL